MDTSAPLVSREKPSRGHAPSGKAFAAVALATAVEFCVITLGFLHVAPIAVLVAAHVGICLLLVLGLAALSPRERGNPTFLLFIICIAAMGPLGPLGTALTMALRSSFARWATPFEQWYAALFPKVTATQTQILYKRIVLHAGGPPKHSTVVPFMDIMALGTVQQKQVVIAMIADGFHPAFASALRSALNDSEPAIRVQAATAVARIESYFLNRAMAVQATRAERPDDADVIFELACHHEEYAISGLLDEGRVRTELKDGLTCCERVRDMRPGDSMVAETGARLLLRLGRPEEALVRLQPVIAQPDASPGALAAYFTCLFRCGHFERLREACRLLGGRINLVALPRGADEAVRLWSEDTAPQAAPYTVAPSAPA